MNGLRRHQLLRLTEAGWHAILAHPWDRQAREVLMHWAMQDLPLVVTRQPRDVAVSGCIALGMPMPTAQGRRRLALHVPGDAVRETTNFPVLEEVCGLFPPSFQRSMRELHAAMDFAGAPARVYGSYGWQSLTGLAYLHPTSDLDLWVPVEGADQADAAAQALRSSQGLLRLDGELVFGDGAAVSWREWIEWRAGRTRAVLVKHLTGAVLRHDAVWCQGAVPLGAVS